LKELRYLELLATVLSLKRIQKDLASKFLSQKLTFRERIKFVEELETLRVFLIILVWRENENEN